MKKTIYLALVGIIAFSLWGCTTWSVPKSRIRKKIAKIEIGMSETEVIDIIGQPYDTQVVMFSDGQIIKVLRYITDYTLNGPIVNSDVTPVCIQDETVIGIGRKFLRNKKRQDKIIHP